MQKIIKQLVLLEDDYKLLISYLNSWHGKTALDRENALSLRAELKKAKLVNMDDFPLDVVRLNSTVKVQADGKNEVMELMLVTPDKADIKDKKISILAPIGTALIGFRKGQKVRWRVPAGEKTFTIVEVTNKQ